MAVFQAAGGDGIPSSQAGVRLDEAGRRVPSRLAKNRGFVVRARHARPRGSADGLVRPLQGSARNTATREHSLTASTAKAANYIANDRHRSGRWRRERSGSQQMPTIQQLVREGPGRQGREDQDPGTEGEPAAARCVHPGPHTTPKKPNSALRKVARVRLTSVGRGHRLHPWCGPQPAGALGGACPWRPCEGPARRALQDHPRLARRPGVHGRKQGRSRYGAKKEKGRPAAQRPGTEALGNQPDPVMAPDGHRSSSTRC